jgi:hypothetical protein
MLHESGQLRFVPTNNGALKKTLRGGNSSSTNASKMHIDSMFLDGSTGGFNALGSGTNMQAIQTGINNVSL